MFEHVRNYHALLKRISKFMGPSSTLLVHHFCHREYIYPFCEDDSWMAKNFFKDGLMPNQDLLKNFLEDVYVQEQEFINGTHYQKTALAWLHNLHINKQSILRLFKQSYPRPKLMYQYWDLFFRACAQLFGYNDGHEWYVNISLLKKKTTL